MIGQPLCAVHHVLPAFAVGGDAGEAQVLAQLGQVLIPVLSQMIQYCLHGNGVACRRAQSKTGWILDAVFRAVWGGRLSAQFRVIQARTSLEALPVATCHQQAGTSKNARRALTEFGN
jgi:hypothetical protein